jgi:hypothetical protein
MTTATPVAISTILATIITTITTIRMMTMIIMRLMTRIGNKNGIGKKSKRVIMTMIMVIARIMVMADKLAVGGRRSAVGGRRPYREGTRVEDARAPGATPITRRPQRYAYRMPLPAAREPRIYVRSSFEARSKAAEGRRAIKGPGTITNRWDREIN